MKKRIIIAVFTGLIICSLLFVAEANAKRKETGRLLIETKIAEVQGIARRTVAEDKAIKEIAEEEKELVLLQKMIAKNERAEAKRKAEEEAERKRIEANRHPIYPGSGHLTRSSGVYYFGNQRETYYNLPMDGVVRIARSRGIGGEYWIRSDGCKMLGNYIIIATNRSVHPYGSIVQTSLGLGISLDTGGFAEVHPYGVDIAVNW